VGSKGCTGRERSDRSAKRLPDRVRVPVRLLLVGINPGMRSAQVGHHFAGPSNRFWKLLYESGLVPEPIRWADDHRLPEFGIGITNLVARPTPGIDALSRSEYAAGECSLRRKVRRWRPLVVAFVGVTLYRAVFGRPAPQPVALGPQREPFERTDVFVLPNPSGRNANFTYAQMLAAFRLLRRQLSAIPPASAPSARDFAHPAPAPRTSPARTTALSRPAGSRPRGSSNTAGTPDS
jgi:TDG/mug DNA glycosylase family protein